MSESIGTLGVHPIDMISAFGAIADGGVLMPRHTIQKVLDSSGNQVWPLNNAKPTGERIASRQASYILTDILAGNTIRSVNPFWGKWRITDGVTGSKVRPAAYKTGTTSDNKDVHAYGFLAPPTNKNLPALVAGVWMGNSDNSPNDGKLSLDTSAPLWSAILSDVSKGMPIEGFARIRPKGLDTAKVDAFTGMKPGAGSRRTVEELFIPGTEPRRSARRRRGRRRRRGVSGLRWREGCAGPMVTRTFIDFSNVESGFRSWQRADIGWQARAARGAGRVGRAEGHAHGLLVRRRLLPVRRLVGRPVRADQELQDRAAAADAVRVDRPVQPVPVRSARGEPDADPGNGAVATANAATVPGG